MRASSSRKRPHACSGAMYSNVPTIAPASSRVSRDRSVESVTRDVEDGGTDESYAAVHEERDAPVHGGTPGRDFRP